MRTRIWAIALGICVVALAACNGGGSSPTPMNKSYRPAANGDAFGYSGTMTESFVRAPLGAGEVTPSPNPTNSETLTSAVTQAVNVSIASSFQGITAPYDFHVVETDSLNGGLKTSTVTSDDYYTYAKSGGTTTIDFAGSNVTTSDGTNYLTVIGTGNGLTDILPEATGALSPANTAAEVTTETDPDSATDVRTIAASGAYTDAGTFPENTLFSGSATSTQAVANADGSGSYSFPLIVPDQTMYTVSAPVSGQIQISVTFSPTLQANGFANEAGAIPVWYPVPVVLSQETLVDNGNSSLPAACNVSGKLAKTPHQLVDTKSTVDPVFGETDTTTTTTYTERGVGVACVQLNDVVNQFYDLSGQTQGVLGFSDTPFQTTTTTETLGITSATVLGLSSVERTSAVELQAGIARFQAHLAQRRMERRAAFRSALYARLTTRGGHL